MKKVILSLLCTAATFALQAQSIQPSDPEATPEARQLLERLDKIRQKGIMYGHQDDLLTGNTSAASSASWSSASTGAWIRSPSPRSARWRNGSTSATAS